MSRIFWDTRMLVYFLEGHEQFGPQVRASLMRSHVRGDTLVTSHLALGELMGGRTQDRERADWLGVTLGGEMGFSFLPFDGKCVTPFARLRSVMGLKGAGRDSSSLCGCGGSGYVSDRRYSIAEQETACAGDSVHRAFQYGCAAGLHGVGSGCARIWEGRY